jgi:predicted lipid-binding transport protein (Tim44 family)
MKNTCFGKLLGFAAVLALTLAPSLAEARAGKSSSAGSRGSRTYSAPAPTPAAPAAKPIERSATPAPPPGSATQPQQAQPQQARPAAQTAAPQPAPAPMSAGRSFFSGLAGGLLGAGLIGMMFGNGFGGGMGGGGFLGGLIQIALLGGLIWLAYSFFRRRAQAQDTSEPALANGRGSLQSRLDSIVNREALGGSGSGSAAPAATSGDAIGLAGEDFDVFEKSLHDIQSAWSRRDFVGLKALVTPEMHNIFEEQLQEDIKAGLENRVESIKLEQGNLSEAWSDGLRDYATVAMRWTAIDYSLDRNTGKIVEGSDRERVEAVEVWTFQRLEKGPWLLSAIQQTA